MKKKKKREMGRSSLEPEPGVILSKTSKLIVVIKLPSHLLLLTN